MFEVVELCDVCRKPVSEKTRGAFVSNAIRFICEDIPSSGVLQNMPGGGALIASGATLFRVGSNDKNIDRARFVLPGTVCSLSCLRKDLNEQINTLESIVLNSTPTHLGG